MPFSPFDWSGGPFLILYAALFFVACATSWIGAALSRPGGRESLSLDAGQLAFLTGGRTRWTDAAVVGQLARGELAFGPGGRFTNADRSERNWTALARDLRPAAARTERELRQLELLVPETALGSLRRWAAGPFLALAAFGAVKVAVGLGRDRPVGFLVAFIAVTLVVALIRWVGVDQRTPAGRAALRQARDAQQRLRLAPTRPEMELGVALFGTAVLSGSAYAPYHAQRAGSGDGGGSSDTSSGSGGGDGGCGSGGGCGGCGS